MSVKTTAMTPIVLLALCVSMRMIGVKSETTTTDSNASPSEEPPFVFIDDEVTEEEMKGALSAEYRGPAFSSLKMYRGSLPRLPGVEDNTWIALHSPVKMYIPIRYTGVSSADSPECVQCPRNMILLLRGRQMHAMMPVPTISICSGFASRSGRVHVAVVSGPRPGQRLTVGRYPVELMVWKADGPIHSCNYTITVKLRRQGHLITKRLSCPKPEQPPHGLVLCVPQNKEVYPHNSVCQFFCMDYFFIENTTTNSSTIVCKNGRWSPHDRATCVASECPAPPDIGFHGSWNCGTETPDKTSFKGGTECKVQCASGYTIRTSQLARARLRCHPPSWNVTRPMPRCERAYLPKLLHCHDRHVIIGIGKKYRMQLKFLPKATTHGGAPLKMTCSLKGRNLKKGLHRNRCEAFDPEMRTQRKCIYHIHIEESSEPKPHPDDCRNRTVFVDLKSGTTIPRHARFLVSVGERGKTKVLHGNCTPSGELEAGCHLVHCETTDPVTNLVGTCSFWVVAKERTCENLMPVRNGHLRCSPDETEDGRFAVGTECKLICETGYSFNGNTSTAVCKPDSSWNVSQFEDCRPVQPPRLMERCEDAEFNVEEPINVTVPQPVFLTSLNETLIAKCKPAFITSDGVHEVVCLVDDDNRKITCIMNVTVTIQFKNISTESTKGDLSSTEPSTTDFLSTELSMVDSLPSKSSFTAGTTPTKSFMVHSLSTESSTSDSSSAKPSSTAGTTPGASSTSDSSFVQFSSAAPATTAESSTSDYSSEESSSTADMTPKELSTNDFSSTESSTSGSSSVKSSATTGTTTESSTVDSSSTESSLVDSSSSKSSSMTGNSPTESSTVDFSPTTESLSIALPDEDDFEEDYPIHVPHLMSTPIAVEANEGENVSFPCLVDDLGDYLLIWMRENNRLLFVGDLKILRDDRISVEGSTLHISSVQSKDRGEYICQISTIPPIVLTHTLDVLTQPVASTTPVPHLVSSPIDVEAAAGEDVSFPCDVDDLGDSVLMWKKGKDTVLFVDNLRFIQDDRISVKGTSLHISSVQPRDKGDYTCQISTNPPIELTHTLDVLISCNPLQELPHRTASCPATLQAGATCELTCDQGYGFPGQSSQQAECRGDGHWHFPNFDDEDAQLECLALPDEDVFEEDYSIPVPQIISTPIAVEATEGQNVSFPCTVKDLGYYVPVWTRENNRVLFVGDMRVLRDDRNSVENTSLHISSVQPKDRGEYICRINTIPPIELTHTLDVLAQPAEDASSTPIPHLVSTPIDVEATAGEDVSFPCDVDDLGDSALTWMRENNRTLFVGNLRVVQDDRFYVKGSSLHISSVQPEDSGEYTCQISTNPPIELTHMLDVLYTCKPLQELSHGTVSCPPTLQAGDTCELTCDPGYGFPGQSSHRAECRGDGHWHFPNLDDEGAQPECLAQVEGSAVEVWISFEAFAPHCDEDLEDEIGDLVQELCQPHTECKDVSTNCTLDEESDMMLVGVNFTVQADFDDEEYSDEDEEIPEAETRLESVLERSRHMIASGDAQPLHLFRDSFRRGFITLVCPEKFMPDMLMAKCVQCPMESGGDCLP